MILTTYIGIDPASTHLDAVIMYSDGTWRIEVRSTMPVDMVGRCLAAERWTQRIVRQAREYNGEPVHLGVESPAMGSGGPAIAASSVIPQAVVHGALLVGAARAGATVYRIAPSAWKKRIVGNGSAKKPDVNRFIKQTWPALWKACKGRQDVCDAGCIVQHVKKVHLVKLKVAATRRHAATSGDVFGGLQKLPKRVTRRR